MYVWTTFFNFLIYLRERVREAECNQERVRERASRGETEREGDTESKGGSRF